MIPLMLDLGWLLRVASSPAGSEIGSEVASLADPAAADPILIRKNIRQKKNGSGFIGVHMSLTGFAIRDR